MTRSNSRAELQKWFLDVDELLAAQREHAISPSTVPSARNEPATWTMTLGALHRDLVGGYPAPSHGEYHHRSDHQPEKFANVDNRRLLEASDDREYQHVHRMLVLDCCPRLGHSHRLLASMNVVSRREDSPRMSHPGY